MSLKLHYDLLSQPSRAVYLLLKCEGIPFEGHTVKIMKGEHLSDDYKKLNPNQKVPAISDGDFNLSESSAILIYIACKNKVADHWYPKTLGSEKQARVNEFLSWQQSGLRKPCIDIFLETLQNKISYEALKKKAMDKDKVEAAKKDLNKALGLIADYYLKGKTFIGGDEISVADILGVCELYQLHGVALLDSLVRSNKKVNEWLNRVIKELQPEFDVAVADLNFIRQKFDGVKK